MMTKENFWNEIEQRWPGELEMFSQWLDEYKKKIHWDDLFHREKREHYWTDLKFHHLPDAIQIGIFYQYTIEEPCRYSFIIEEKDSLEKIAENIKEWFCEEHEDAYRDHLEGKYFDDNI